MFHVLDREVLLHRGDKWLALEGDYWHVMLRLIKAHGLDAERYVPPAPGQRSYIKADTTKKLVVCINQAIEDIPKEDLWRFHENDPDPRTTPPHEFFSGVGVSYFETLLNFVGNEGIFIEISEPGGEYRFKGESPKRPGS